MRNASLWSLFFGRKYREKIVQHMVQAIAVSPLPHLLDRKDSPAPAALAAGAGHYFLPFPIVDCNAVSWFSICS